MGEASVLPMQRKRPLMLSAAWVAPGPGNANTAKKVRHALLQIDRMLDVFEPGQLAFSFNGGKVPPCSPSSCPPSPHLFVLSCSALASAQPCCCLWLETRMVAGLLRVSGVSRTGQC